MDHNDEGTGLEGDDNQALWKLLGHARPVEVSPYFARRVLRDLDAGSAVDEAAGWRAWLRPGWILAGSAAAVGAVVLGVASFSSPTVVQPRAVVSRRPIPSLPTVVIQQPVSPVRARPAVTAVPMVAAMPVTPVVKADAAIEVADDVSPQDVDVIADLDNLVAREETNVWTDDTSRF